jgi:glutathione S-transferase
MQGKSPGEMRAHVLKLYSYPTLFGVADNNGYGLKVFAFLKLAGVPFHHEHIFDASAAPRGQLPYIVDGNDTIGDSEAILAYVTKKYGVAIDASLTPAQQTTNLLVTRTLDDLYWVMSYSRWKDERFWKAFHDALLREHPQLTEEGLAKAKAYNSQRYYYQGIGRYDPDAVMARGLRNLGALAHLIPEQGYLHGKAPTSIDAGIYGFIANIYFYEIDTPLKRFVTAHENIVQHCRCLHQIVSKTN